MKVEGKVSEGRQEQKAKPVNKGLRVRSNVKAGLDGLGTNHSQTVAR